MPTKIWWIIRKDIVLECQARRVWPAMLSLGVVVAFLFSIQMDVHPDDKSRLIAGQFWLTTFFAGILALDWSFSAEREDRCWDALLLYPVSRATIYLAKLAVNTLALMALQSVLVLAFVVFCDAPLLEKPVHLLIVGFLGNLGITSVGTLVSALSSGIRQGASLLMLVVLPLVIPIILAASEATRLTMESSVDSEWLR